MTPPLIQTSTHQSRTPSRIALVAIAAVLCAAPLPAAFAQGTGIGPAPVSLGSADATFLTKAVGDMGSAYDDAYGRASPNYTELGAGEIGGLALFPGLYKWSTDLLITTDVTLSGGPNDVWIFQVAGALNQANAARMTLAGGARAKNIFWQIAGPVTIGTTARFEGVLLAKTLIAVNTGASVNGRLLAPLTSHT